LQSWSGQQKQKAMNMFVLNLPLSSSSTLQNMGGGCVILWRPVSAFYLFCT
jgi:hypothetical protein